MTWGMVAVAGATLVGGAMSSSAAKSGAQTQAGAADRAAELQQAQYEQTRQDQMPFLEAGYSALNKLAPLSENYQKFGMDQFQQDPGYAFRLSEGQQATRCGRSEHGN